MDTLELALNLLINHIDELTDEELIHLNEALNDEIAYRATLRNAIALGLVEEDED